MIKTYKQLKLGQKRLVLVLSIVFALLISYLADNRDFLDFDDIDFYKPLIIGWIIYWPIVLIILWVIEGFKNPKE